MSLWEAITKRYKRDKSRLNNLETDTLHFGILQRNCRQAKLYHMRWSSKELSGSGKRGKFSDRFVLFKLWSYSEFQMIK